MYLKKYFLIVFSLCIFFINIYAKNTTVQNGAKLTMLVTSALAKEKDVPLSELSIHVYKGDVSLCGFVNDKEKHATLRAMRNVEGVNQLYDDLILRSKIDKEKRNASLKQNVSDSWITTKVKQKLLVAENISSTAIIVETYKGNVLLCGYLDTEDMVNKSIKLAYQIKGVRFVINGLKVKLL